LTLLLEGFLKKKLKKRFPQKEKEIKWKKPEACYIFIPAQIYAPEGPRA
jgi:hypothetical protein